jgi:hypothetical protein
VYAANFLNLTCLQKHAKQMLESLKDEDFFWYVLADFKHSLDCLSFFCAQNAGDGFL